MLKVGIVGVGKRGTQFLNSLWNLDLCKISYLCDRKEEKLRSLQERHPAVRVTTNYRDVKNDIDAVVVATPPDTHFEIASFFLKQGIPVLLEKPSTLIFEETEELFRIARQNNIHIQIGYTERYSPPSQKIKEILQKEGDNTRYFIEALRCNEFSERVRGVDVIMDLMIHDIDIIINITKKELVYLGGFTSSIYDSCYDFAKVIFKCGDNIFIECTASRVSSTPIRTIMVYKADTIYKLDFLDQSFTIYCKKETSDSEVLDSPIKKYIGAKVIKEDFKNLIVEQFKEFVRFLKNPSSYDHSVDLLTLKTINDVKKKLSQNYYSII